MQIKAEEIDILLKGSGALDITSVRKKPKVIFQHTQCLHCTASHVMPCTHSCKSRQSL